MTDFLEFTKSDDSIVAAFRVWNETDEQGPIQYGQQGLWAPGSPRTFDALADVAPELIDNLFEALGAVLVAARPDLKVAPLAPDDPGRERPSDQRRV